MADADIALQVWVGTFLTAGACLLVCCIRKIRNSAPKMKQSRSMEELNAVTTDNLT